MSLKNLFILRIGQFFQVSTPIDFSLICIQNWLCLRTSISVTSPQQQKKRNVRNLTPETQTEVEQLFASSPLDENIRNRQPVIFRFLHKAHIHIQRTKTHETSTDRAHLHNAESIKRPTTVGSCPCPLELWEKTSRRPQHATELPGRNHPGRWCRTQRACVLAPELGPTALEHFMEIPWNLRLLPVLEREIIRTNLFCMVRDELRIFFW